MIRTRLCLTLFLSGLVPPALAQTDAFLGAVQAAQRAYQGGNLGDARAALEQAQELLTRRRLASLAEALPVPLPGWTAAAAQEQMPMDPADGATVSRRYRDAQGRSLAVALTIESPTTTALATAMADRGMAASLGQLVRIGDRDALQVDDELIQMPVNNRVMIAISGDAPMEAKLAYARAIDVARLATRH